MHICAIYIYIYICSRPWTPKGRGRLSFRVGLGLVGVGLFGIGWV